MQKQHYNTRKFIKTLASIDILTWRSVLHLCQLLATGGILYLGCMVCASVCGHILKVCYKLPVGRENHSIYGFSEVGDKDKLITF